MLFTEVYYLRYHAYFVVVDHIDFAAAMTVKLKEHLQIHGYCSYVKNKREKHP